MGDKSPTMAVRAVLFTLLVLATLGLVSCDVDSSAMTSSGVNATAQVCTCYSVTSRAYVKCTNVTSVLASLATGLDTGQVDISGLLKHEALANCTACEQQTTSSLLPVFSACPPLLSPCELCWQSGDNFTVSQHGDTGGGGVTDPGHNADVTTTITTTPSSAQLWQQQQQDRVRHMSDDFATQLQQGSVDITSVNRVVIYLNDVIASANVTSLNNDTVQAIVDVYADVMTVSTDILTQAEIQHGTVTRCLTAIEHIGAAYDMGQSPRVDFNNDQFSVTLTRSSGDTPVIFTAAVDPGPSLNDVIADLPEEGRGRGGRGDAAIASVAAARGRQTGITLPPSALHAVNNESLLLQFVNFNNTVFFQILTNLSTTVTSSRNVLGDSVVAAIVVSGSADLSHDPAIIAFRPRSQGTVNDSVAVSCVWWNFSSSDWSSDGCHVANRSRDGLVTCHCSHLTNFALLMDVYGAGADDNSSIALVISVASLLGCGLSLAGTTFTLLTFAVFRKLLADIPSKILVNLCGAILGMLVMFIVASDPGVRNNGTACKTVAVLLHYFVLVTWLWMANQGYFIYVAVIRTFPTYFRHFMRNTSIAAWGGPVLPIIITLVVGNTSNYSSQGQLCWLSRDAFYGACLSVVLVIIVINTVAFGLILHQLRRSKVNVIQDLGSTSEQFRRRIRGAVGLFTLLGLTWLFAIFAVGGAGVTFELLFCIFNSTQGFFIFIVYCLASTEVRQAWSGAVACRACCCHHGNKNSSKNKSKTKTGSAGGSAQCKSQANNGDISALNTAPPYGRFYDNLTQRDVRDGSEVSCDASAVTLTISRPPSSLEESSA